jgi:hypothetical protein
MGPKLQLVYAWVSNLLLLEYVYVSFTRTLINFILLRDLIQIYPDPSNPVSCFWLDVLHGAFVP